MSYLQAEIAANLIEHVVTPILEDYTEDWGFFNWSSTDQLLDELRTVILISVCMTRVTCALLKNELSANSGVDSPRYTQRNTIRNTQHAGGIFRI